MNQACVPKLQAGVVIPLNLTDSFFGVHFYSEVVLHKLWFKFMFQIYGRYGQNAHNQDYNGQRDGQNV